MPRRLRRLFLASILLCSGAPALAHRQASDVPAPSQGVSIPSLTHGQMQVIAANLAAISALADAQIPTDPIMRRLQSYVNLQSFVCLWGKVPGSVTDEDSPFNECAHAYLAGGRALLVRLRELPGDKRAVEALARDIEAQMLANGAALTLCRFSDEPFNTAQIVYPRWREVPYHAPSALTLGAVLALIAAAMAALAFVLRRAEGDADAGERFEF